MKNLILLFLIIAAIMMGCDSTTNDEKLVVLTFDDAVQSHIDFVAPLLIEKGFGATFFITAAWMNDTDNFMNWEDVAYLHKMGFEIGNHSWTHEPLHKEEAIAEMGNNLAKVDSALLANGVPRPVSFGYPGNHFSPGTIRKLRELGYRFARRGMQPEIPYGQIAIGPLYDPDKNHRLVIPTTADAYPEWTLDHFKEIIGRAEKGKAIILQFHGVPDEAHPWVHTDPGKFKQFMDYLQQEDVKVIALKDLDNHFKIGEADDPALAYTNGVPGRFNPCPVDADVWVLAGQSNMQGAGRTPDTLINNQIWMMNLDDKWRIAKSPLHRIFEARAPAYYIAFHELYGKSGHSLADTRNFFNEQRQRSIKNPIGGVGPGLYFARSVVEARNKPVGLIPCALGGSTIEQWDPAEKAEGDSSLYGAMLNRIKSVGKESIKGLIWSQGESEAMLMVSESYQAKLLQFIDSFREDLDSPDLPVIILQAGRFINEDPEMALHWQTLRDAQLKAVGKRKNLYLTTGIDLELDDCVHFSTQANKRLGKRLAEIALSEVYQKKGHGKQIIPLSLELKMDTLSGSYYLHLHYEGVSGELKADGLISCFEIRFNDEIRIMHVISRAETDPEDRAGIRLYLSGLPEESFSLICGPGLNPHMNITDSRDMPVPAFGPVMIDIDLLKGGILKL